MRQFELHPCEPHSPEYNIRYHLFPSLFIQALHEFGAHHGQFAAYYRRRQIDKQHLILNVQFIGRFCQRPQYFGPGCDNARFLEFTVDFIFAKYIADNLSDGRCFGSFHIPLLKKLKCTLPYRRCSCKYPCPEKSFRLECSRIRIPSGFNSSFVSIKSGISSMRGKS